MVVGVYSYGDAEKQGPGIFYLFLTLCFFLLGPGVPLGGAGHRRVGRVRGRGYMGNGKGGGIRKSWKRREGVGWWWWWWGGGLGGREQWGFCLRITVLD
jgi:hypothetical protein